MFAPVPGDVAGTLTPRGRATRPVSVALANATITGEDPAVPRAADRQAVVRREAAELAEGNAG